MDGQSYDTLAIYHTNRLSLSHYPYLQDGAVLHVQPTHGPDARSLQWNEIRPATHQSSVHQGSVCCSFCGYHCRLRLYSQIASCKWRRRDAEVRKTFVFWSLIFDPSVLCIRTFCHDFDIFACHCLYL